MALSIQSPGVQIIETDLSQTVTIPTGTSVYVAGFAPQGPTDEVIQITSISEFESIFGTPTNAAESYFYYNCQAVLNSSGNLLTTRLPYGSGNGLGFAATYSALVYPVVSASTGFTIGSPVHQTLTQSQYLAIQQSNFTWGVTNPTTVGIGTQNNVVQINGGLIVLNDAQTAVDEYNQGYYVNIADNTNWGPTSPYTEVINVVGLSAQDTFQTVPPSSLAFTLTAAYGTQGSSISQVIESVPTYNFGNASYNDSLVLTLFKIRKSTYQPNVLTYSLVESYIGSLNQNRTISKWY